MIFSALRQHAKCKQVVTLAFYLGNVAQKVKGYGKSIAPYLYPIYSTPAISPACLHSSLALAAPLNIHPKRRIIDCFLYKNLLVEHNVIHSSFWSGITLADTLGAVVRNNTVLNNPDSYLTAADGSTTTGTMSSWIKVY